MVQHEFRPVDRSYPANQDGYRSVLPDAPVELRAGYPGLHTVGEAIAIGEVSTGVSHDAAPSASHPQNPH